MMVSCLRSCMCITFEGVDCILVQIIQAKCKKCKKAMSLENTNHVETYLVNIDANNTKVLCNTCDRVFGS